MGPQLLMASIWNRVFALQKSQQSSDAIIGIIYEFPLIFDKKLSSVPMPLSTAFHSHLAVNLIQCVCSHLTLNDCQWFFTFVKITKTNTKVSPKHPSTPQKSFYWFLMIWATDTKHLDEKNCESFYLLKSTHKQSNKWKQRQNLISFVRLMNFLSSFITT